MTKQTEGSLKKTEKKKITPGLLCPVRPQLRKHIPLIFKFTKGKEKLL